VEAPPRFLAPIFDCFLTVSIVSSGRVGLMGGHSWLADDMVWIGDEMWGVGLGEEDECNVSSGGGLM